MDELIEDFVAETREMLEGASNALIAWETNPGDRGAIDEIFRFVHTVKGSCGFLDLPRIAALAHAAEDALAAMRSGEREADSALVGAVLAIIDQIGGLVESLAAGTAPNDPSTDAQLIAGLSEPTVVAAVERAGPTASATVRVPTALLDQMMDQVSDLVLTRNDLARRLRTLDQGSQVEAAFGILTQAVGSLRDSIGRARLQPIERLFRALPRLVRDTAAQLGKDVALSIEGDDVEIDREMIEALRDPLTHIVRNAIDHGLEDAKGRRDRGKLPSGQLRVVARQSGNQVSVRIEDDGRGIDTQRLLDRAKAAGVTGLGQLSAEQAALLIFEPGLSTAAAVTDISGRGVGMDVVRTNIERLGGSVSLDNRPGQGLAVIIRVPLTLSILNCLIVEVGSVRLGLPRAAVDEVLAVNSQSIRYEAIGNTHVAAIRGELLSVVPLATVLGLPEAAAQRLVVIDAAGLRYVLPVERIAEQEELVVRPLAPMIGALGLFTGQSLPDDGRPLLLLDALGLAQRAGIARVGHAQRTLDGLAGETRSACALTFIDLDGEVRAIRAIHVDRIEDVDASDYAAVRTRRFVRLDGTLRPAQAIVAPPAAGKILTLRLIGADGLIGRAVAQVLDLVPLGEVTPVEDPELEGLVLVDERPVPLLRVEPLSSGSQARLAA